MRTNLKVLGIFLLTSAMVAANWDAAPIDVHEWGVNTFDWDTGKPLQQDFPGYLYTDRKPGDPHGPAPQRVRDLPPDSGIRTKPILYFYPSKASGRGSSGAQVGVEMRFAEGYANAWWPQVNHYRTEEESKKAGAPDWEAWKKSELAALKERMMQSNEDGRAEERWNLEFSEYEKLTTEEQVKRLASHRPWTRVSDLPEDKRMQLVWENLVLHSEIPEGLTLPGSDLPDDHWAKIAREVDAAFVSNGKEVERYLFYEGKTREEPAIALVPTAGGERVSKWHLKSEPVAREVSLVNVGSFPIYDVFAVYRDSEKGILWTGYLAMMPPQEVSLRIPDFERPRKDDLLHLGKREFRSRTSDRFIECLTAGDPVLKENIFMRDPADPQGPTLRHQLYRKEAVGLEKIWHDDFFEAEGLTVLYREAPAYLDQAMPLNLFTSMYWSIRLSRCGLVLNRNLPLDQVRENEKALWNFQIADWNPHLQEKLESESTPILKRNRLLTLGQARFYLPGRAGESDPQLEKVRALFE